MMNRAVRAGKVVQGLAGRVGRRCFPEKETGAVPFRQRRKKPARIGGLSQSWNIWPGSERQTRSLNQKVLNSALFR
ncbi:MAG: hypothetical protein CMN76_12595 [Spirochaetaceae bacterium]|nr:hypothetical protein [Spirochaetaceae bacterium]